MTLIAPRCRLSGESLDDADILFEIPECPIPGIYPATPDEARGLESPLRVVQAKHSGLVQLGHIMSGEIYRQYAFSGGGGAAYRRHLKELATKISQQYDRDAYILEVGCGDGWLLMELKARGFANVVGIDPSRAAGASGADYITTGYFPKDLPAQHRSRKFSLIITRHVLEHIETPVSFINDLASHLNADGCLWVEVPDLESTIRRGLWSNFYQLHCSYYSAVTLDMLAAKVGLRCVDGTIVDVFGGSLLRKYTHGREALNNAPSRVAGIHQLVVAFQKQLNILSACTPLGTMGYGAAERTAVTFGFSPSLKAVLSGLYDGNSLLAERYMAGTELRIQSKQALISNPPTAILLFAISNIVEIVDEWRRVLPKDILVAAVGIDSSMTPLSHYHVAGQ